MHTTPHPLTAPSRGCVLHWFSVAVLILAGHAYEAAGSTLVVPDDLPSIQPALTYRLADTVLVRPGSYPERLSISNEVVLRAYPMPANATAAAVLIDAVFIDYRREPDPGAYGPVRVEGIGVRGGATIVNWTYPIDILFDTCRLDSGIVELSTFVFETWELRIRRCLVDVTAVLAARIVTADSCVFNCPVQIASDGDFSLAHNVVNGSVNGTTYEGCEIRGNVLTGGGSITVDAIGPVVIVDNQIRECPGIGISAENINRMTIAGNDIAHARIGIYVRGEFVDMLNNVVVAAESTGIRLRSNEPCTVRGNVVGRCGADGMIIVGGIGIAVQGNTAYLNDGAGITILNGEQCVITQNIGHRNGTVGLKVTGTLVSELACNDWYGNAEGPVDVGFPRQSDLYVDPLFCDVENDDVRLRSDSPLLGEGGCGLIGALGVGCDVPTPTLLRQFEVERVAGGVRIVWLLAGEEAGEVALQRGSTASGPWVVVEGERVQQGEVTVVVDRGVAKDETWWYRLVGRNEAGMVVLGSPIVVSARDEASFGLTAVTPNPCRDAMAVEFKVGHQAEIELDLFDIQGRVVASLARGTWSAGRHQVAWSGQTPTGTAAPGVYVVRYRYPGGEEHRRIVRTR